jgi:hypothetical protein
MPIIPATPDVEIRKISVRRHPGQNVSEMFLIVELHYRILGRRERRRE